DVEQCRGADRPIVRFDQLAEHRHKDGSGAAGGGCVLVGHGPDVGISHGSIVAQAGGATPQALPCRWSGGRWAAAHQCALSTTPQSRSTAAVSAPGARGAEYVADAAFAKRGDAAG